MIARGVAWGAIAGMLLGLATGAAILCWSADTSVWAGPVASIVFVAMASVAVGSVVGLLVGLVDGVIVAGLHRIVVNTVATGVVAALAPVAVAAAVCWPGVGIADDHARAVFALFLVVCAVLAGTLGPVAALDDKRSGVGPESLLRGGVIGIVVGPAAGAACGAQYAMLVGGPIGARTLHGAAVGIAVGALLGMIGDVLHTNAARAR